MLTSRARTGWGRLPSVLIPAAVLVSGIAGLAGFAMSMSEAPPAPSVMASASETERPDVEARPGPLPDAEPLRPVRVVYPGR